MFAIVDAWDFPHDNFTQFFMVLKPPSIWEKSLEFPATFSPFSFQVLQRPGLLYLALALCALDASLNSESLGKSGKYYGITMGLPRKFLDVQSNY